MNNRVQLPGAVHWRDGLAGAWHTIIGHRMRSSLLILGVAVGVTTLLAIYTIVSGLSQRIHDDVVSANQPYIYIARYDGLGGMDPEEAMRRPQLLPDVIPALENTEGVSLVDYEVSNNSMITLSYEQEKTNMTQPFGCSENFPFMFSLSVADGRFFTAAEVASRDRVVVLGFGVKESLFPYLDPIGKTVRIYGNVYRVVGTMTARDMIMGSFGDNYVAIPWTVFENDCLHEGMEDRNIALTSKEGYDTDEVISNVVGSMRVVRRLRASEKNDFDVVSSETYGEMVNKITGGIAMVLVVLSSIGLLVGGIGVMNIMLISVTERTREIGVRMALGARRQDVLKQILVESAILTGIGGILGIGLGYLASWGMTNLLSFPFQVSPFVTIGAALFSISIGIFFGIYPANKAARLDPIVALGRE